MTLLEQTHDLIEQLINETQTEAMATALEKARECYFWLLFDAKLIPKPPDSQ